MINYYLRPDQTQVKIDSDLKTVTNIVNKANQKIIGHFTEESYYIRIAADATTWSESNEVAYNDAKTVVLTYLSSNL